MNRPSIPRNDRETDRVRRRTLPTINRRIDAKIERNIRFYAAQPREVISRRIRELECEWDIERALQANAATLALVGLSCSVTRHRGWLALPAAVLGFLLMHAIQGWCPPVPLLRRLGVRTREEIDREKYALKFLRGDFEDIAVESYIDRPGEVLEAVER